MTMLDGISRASTGAPTARLVVLLSKDGLRIQPDLAVGLPELLLVEALAAGDVDAHDDGLVARVAAETGAAPEHLAGFAQMLRDRRLLANRPAPLRQLGDAVPQPDQPIAVDADAELVIECPILFRVSDHGFETLDHDGLVRARLSARQLIALMSLTRPVTRTALQVANDASAAPLGAGGVDALIRSLRVAGLLSAADSDSPQAIVDHHTMAAIRRQLQLEAAVRASVAAHERDERARRERTGTTRTRVVPVAFDGPFPPLGLGFIVAHAKAYEGERLQEKFHFCPNWITDRQQITEIAGEPSIFLFSTYLWSCQQCLEIAELVKSINPANVTVFGGPSTPKYEGDCKEFFARYPYVDVTVRGEGEVTATKILAALARGAAHEGAPDLSVLADVAGLSFRDGDRVVRTADRDRIADLDTIPSPFLTGLFDAYASAPHGEVIIETNRGCPYGCTFCDWGSATLSRLRKFSLDRVFAELDWCARNGVKTIAPADSNFGIWSRDVDITRHVVELKRQYGSPNVFGVNFAKNTAKHLREIIQLLIEAGIFTYGVLSLQSMDADTLDAIDRQNIRLSKYDELAVEFRKAGLPLFVDLMVGLPGQTAASFRNDVQECIDREVQIRLPITVMLVNSPMNEPAYRKRFGIVTSSSPLDPTQQALVVRTSTFSDSDYQEMRALRLAVLLTEDLGALRQVSRYVRADTGLREVDFYDRLRRDAAADPDRWPHLALTMQVLPHVAMPPVSWRLLIDELHDYLTQVIGVADDSALATVLTVQHALLPARDRRLPVSLELHHDFAAWHNQMLVAKNDGHGPDWPAVVPPLRSFAPATFTVDDPGGVAHWSIGGSVERHSYGMHWELESDVARPVARLSNIVGAS